MPKKRGKNKKQESFSDSCSSIQPIPAQPIKTWTQIFNREFERQDQKSNQNPSTSSSNPQFIPNESQMQMISQWINSLSQSPQGEEIQKTIHCSQNRFTSQKSHSSSTNFKNPGNNTSKTYFHTSF